jgi:hypothetical protein
MNNVVEFPSVLDNYRDYNESPLITVMMLQESCDGIMDSDLSETEKLCGISLMNAAAHYIVQFLHSGKKHENYYEIVDIGLSVAIGRPVKNGIGLLPDGVSMIQVDDYLAFVNNIIGGNHEV